MKIIDATNAILGRLANQVAKMALEGEQVAVVNCEKAIISGSRKDIFERFLMKRARGCALKGPFYPKQSDRIVRRAIKGMLPCTSLRGRLAFKKVKCYLDVPFQFANQKLQTLESASADKLSTEKYLKIGEIANRLGGK